MNLLSHLLHIFEVAAAPVFALRGHWQDVAGIHAGASEGELC